MRNCGGFLKIKFISLDFNAPTTTAVEPYFCIDYGDGRSFKTPVATMERPEVFKWSQMEDTLDFDIPRGADEVHLFLVDRLTDTRWGLYNMAVSELNRSPLPEVQLEVISDPITGSLHPLTRGDLFLGAKLTFAYDFFPTVYTTCRKFGLDSNFLALTPEATDPNDSFYLKFDGWPYGNLTRNGIGPFSSLEDVTGQGYIWSHWAPGPGVPAELGVFNESTKNYITIDVYRAADDTVSATGV
ncbi:unnamed protein product [Trifolium pratense]|uniref:Uncharacterized protein n=1 Tax=Trifolium pratense TaxID=57577 RepID=A0ACB0JIW6_TRIPR|nr:unnamed protein product [Trifolium pratense]